MDIKLFQLYVTIVFSQFVDYIFILYVFKENFFHVDVIKLINFLFKFLCVLLTKLFLILWS